MTTSGPSGERPALSGCPGCGSLVPQAWDSCRRCGAVIRTPAHPFDEAPPEPAARDAVAPEPIAPAQPHTRFRVSRRLVVFGAGAVLLVVVAGFVWAASGDGGNGDTSDAVAAVRDAEQTASESPLFAAQAIATEAYAAQGSYTAVTPALLQQADPSITWLAGTTTPAVGEVSAQAVNGETMVLSTTLQSGVCQAMLLAPSGVSQIPAYVPCAAANVQPPGQGGHGEDATTPDSQAQP